MRWQKQPQFLKTEKSANHFLPWLMVTIIIAITAGIRLHFLDVPFERDEGEYAYAGQLLLQGIPPYSHVYNMKLPGIYAAYALILAIFGQTHIAVRVGLLIINAVTIILIFLLAKYEIDHFTGVFVAAAFAILSLSQSVQGTFANAEHFVILFAVAGILLLVYAVDRNKLTLLLAASLSLGIAFLMKQHGFAFVVFAGLYLLFSHLRGRQFELKPFLLRAVLFTVGVTFPFGVTCLILWRVGVFEKFWFWTFEYAREYVSIVSIPDGLKLLKFTLTRVVNSAILIWILVGIGLLTLFIEKTIRSRSPFIVGFLIFSFLATCPGFHFRPHYFILLLPAIALLFGVGLFGVRHALWRRKPTIGKDLLAVSLGTAMLLCALYQQKNFLLAEDPDVISRMTYHFNPFPESLKIAEYIMNDSSRDDKIAILGSEPQIFFYSNRHSASSYIYVYPLMEPHLYALQMQKEMIQQVETAKPKFLIFVSVSSSWLLRPTSEKLILNWFQQYHRQYYDKVGVIDIVSIDETIYRWNESAINYTPRSKYWLAVFKRKNEI